MQLIVFIVFIYNCIYYVYTVHLKYGYASFKKLQNGDEFSPRCITGDELLAMNFPGDELLAMNFPSDEFSRR